MDEMDVQRKMKERGEKLRLLRFQKNVTNADIARYVGGNTSEEMISQVIHGKKTLCFEKMAKLAEFFGVSLDYLA